jgi:tRNA pseudouridine38-40 synthase
LRIALGLQYDGAGFSGWQSQAGGNTVQDVMESALSAVAAQLVRVHCAGRTDAGVHALCQVIHFDTDAQRPDNAWVRGVNAHLPVEVAVQWAVPVADDFHARFSAVERSYCYVLQVSPVRPALLAGKVGWFHLPLEIAAMRAAAAHLAGRHDFSAFRSAECQAKSPERMLHKITIEQFGAFFLFRLTANAFLHHMVRNIVGSLIQVGKGAQPPTWLKAVLDSRERAAAAATFAPDGLYLERVSYAPHWELPAGLSMSDVIEPLVKTGIARRVAAGMVDR